MIDLAAVTNRTFLEFHEVAHLDAIPEFGAWTQARERTELAALAGGSTFDVAVWMNHGARADTAVTNHVIGFDADAIAELDVALEDGVDVDEHIATAPERAADVDARRIREADALGHEFVDEARLQRTLGLSQLFLVVDTHNFFLAVGLDAVNRDAVGDGHLDDVGEVILALRVVVAEPVEPAL